MCRATEFLLQIRRVDRIIENKIAEKEQWKALSLNTVAAPPADTGVRVQSSGDHQRMASAIERYIVIDEEINKWVDELVKIKRDVTSVIEQLDTVEYDVLHKMYVGQVNVDDPRVRVKYWTLNEIAELYDRSYNWAKAKRGQARKNVQKILDSRKTGEH